MLREENFVTADHDWLVEVRRWLHQHPEPAYGEKETAAKIAGILEDLGVPFQSGVGGTGVVARLKGGKPGPDLVLRADMDALPLEEANDVPYRSRKPGWMHACGHDAHVAIVLGVVRRLAGLDWIRQGRGTVHFFFQPAEEGGAGARAMLETGVLDGVTVDAAFAGHVHPELPLGHVGISPEVSNAASDGFSIEVEGKGGHGAQPHLCSDPVVAAAHLVTLLQTVASRNVPPLESVVLTVGSFHAGTASNIIPRTARLEGTLRTLDPEVRELAIRRMEQLAAGVEAAFQCAVRPEISEGYPVLRNHPALASWAVERLRELLGDEGVHWGPPRMGAEDFAYFTRRFPGVMVRLGCRTPGTEYAHGLHSPFFDLDERVLDTGVELFTRLLTRCAESPWNRPE